MSYCTYYLPYRYGRYSIVVRVCTRRYSIWVPYDTAVPHRDYSCPNIGQEFFLDYYYPHPGYPDTCTTYAPRVRLYETAARRRRRGGGTRIVGLKVQLYRNKPAGHSSSEFKSFFLGSGNESGLEKSIKSSTCIF